MAKIKMPAAKNGCAVGIKNKNNKNRFENIGLSDHDAYIVKMPM